MVVDRRGRAHTAREEGGPTIATLRGHDELLVLEIEGGRRQMVLNSNSTHLVIEDRTDGRGPDLRLEIPSEQSLSAWKIQFSGLFHPDRDDLIRLRVQSETGNNP